jgi:hypothetical protein
MAPTHIPHSMPMHQRTPTPLQPIMSPSVLHIQSSVRRAPGRDVEGLGHVHMGDTSKGIAAMSILLLQRRASPHAITSVHGLPSHEWPHASSTILIAVAAMSIVDEACGHSCEGNPCTEVIACGEARRCKSTRRPTDR